MCLHLPVHVDNGHIADHPAKTYDSLCNSDPPDENMERITAHMSEYCEQLEEHDRVVNQHDVDKVIWRLTKLVLSQFL